MSLRFEVAGLTPICTKDLETSPEYAHCCCNVYLDESGGVAIARKRRSLANATRLRPIGPSPKPDPAQWATLSRASDRLQLATPTRTPSRIAPTSPEDFRPATEIHPPRAAEGTTFLGGLIGLGRARDPGLGQDGDSRTTATAQSYTTPPHTVHSPPPNSDKYSSQIRMSLVIPALRSMGFLLGGFSLTGASPIAGAQEDWQGNLQHNRYKHQAILVLYNSEFC